jgi:hypothetical protein
VIAAELFSAKNKQPEGWDFGSLLRFQLAGTLLVCVLLAATLSAWGSFTLSISCDSPLVTLVLKLSDDLIERFLCRESLARNQTQPTANFLAFAAQKSLRAKIPAKSPSFLISEVIVRAINTDSF